MVGSKQMDGSPQEKKETDILWWCIFVFVVVSCKIIYVITFCLLQTVTCDKFLPAMMTVNSFSTWNRMKGILLYPHVFAPGCRSGMRNIS